MVFTRQRFFHQRYQIGLLLGLVIIISHVYFGQITEANTWLNGINLFNLAISEWIIFDFRGPFTDIFLFSLPILCSLGASLVITEDLQSGFANHLVQFSLKKYLINNLIVAFSSGVLTGVIPLLLDYIMAIWFFPNKVPNLVVNHGANAINTYGIKLFYKQPFLIILLYLTIVGVTGGIYSLISVLSGIMSRNRYIAMSFPFLLVTILTIGSDFLPNYIFSPTYIMVGNSPRSLPPLTGVITVYFLIIIGTIWIIWHEFKSRVTI